MPAGSRPLALNRESPLDTGEREKEVSSPKEAYRLKTRIGVVSFLLAGSALAATAWLFTACPTTYDLVTSADITFDGSFLGPCGPDSGPVSIEAGLCPSSCVNGALAYCVGNTYTECACILEPPCDSGCCANMLTGYVPQKCKGLGQVALPDPSEGLCDAANGYLLCNNLCYATFVCDLPDGYSVIGPEAGPRDAGKDAPHEAATDATLDAPTDGTIGEAEAGDAGGDADADAHD